MDHNVVKFLRLASIIAGAFWLIRVQEGFSQFNALGAITNLPAFDAARKELWLNFAGALALILAGVLFKPKGPTRDTHVKCPDCRELVLKEANVCKHCGCKLIPQ
jgi:hypothetical protein